MGVVPVPAQEGIGGLRVPFSLLTHTVDLVAVVALSDGWGLARAGLGRNGYRCIARGTGRNGEAASNGQVPFGKKPVL